MRDEHCFVREYPRNLCWTIESANTCFIYDFYKKKYTWHTQTRLELCNMDDIFSPIFHVTYKALIMHIRNKIDCSNIVEYRIAYMMYYYWT